MFTSKYDEQTTRKGKQSNANVMFQHKLVCLPVKGHTIKSANCLSFAILFCHFLPVPLPWHYASYCHDEGPSLSCYQSNLLCGTTNGTDKRVRLKVTKSRRSEQGHRYARTIFFLLNTIILIVTDQN